MGGIATALQGKKTYIIAFAVVLMVALEKLGGIDIPGFDASTDWLSLVMGALGLSTLRAAVTPSQ